MNCERCHQRTVGPWPLDGFYYSLAAPEHPQNDWKHSSGGHPDKVVVICNACTSDWIDHKPEVMRAGFEAFMRRRDKK